jgi:hypothetical protein
MFTDTLSTTRRQIFGTVIVLATIASIGMASAQHVQSQPASAEEQLHNSSGRETDLQIARNRPTQRETAARVRDERSTWSYAQWDAYARSLRGQ